ncbi:CRISPR system Cascade subunit CasA [Aliiroseovarius crassostreae]|uniref:Type I-E CRISPR-associated protein Cse1/CasA n=1 Tax=Aliiroseovarius crassostreae TaxID=154981 RepID=A0A0P7KH56_9RHOB|nr:type I-E CRISPR-associated protein Cse1/CasA [Aliiroseovarius crassostreae]KPN62650.1 hypothetical protein AKJ29_00215 [Aliiroseovarius crassostreae]SFU96141.1 CRISPR system Cascade subunit CasA [Aliiroseovarius crassostreae]
MHLNLITDPWIPVRLRSGDRRVIAPWQIADPDIAFPDWPRPDLNVACLELLIGLVFMADPPAHEEEWQDRERPDPDRLKARLAPFAPAFNLLGDGKRFLQDLEPLEGAPNSPDMLFIDSAGANTVRNNADLMVWRGRYGDLALPLAAMALYTFQSFAPSGGAGNRTSMRGGGPMVTLIDPGQGLWPLIWANVPDGRPADTDHLPWMRPTRVSNKAQQVFPEQSHPVEAFFGMPRRVRLVGDDTVTGVIQRPYGTNYAGWMHPLSPYYRQKVGAEWLPKHPRPGAFGYRHWLGVIAAQPETDATLTRRAQMVRLWGQRSGHRPAQVLVAGWSMDNMKPRDFILAAPPLVSPDGAAQRCLIGMIEAADLMSLALRASLGPVLAEGEAREAVREAFYAHTEALFQQLATGLTAVNTAQTATDWLAEMRRVALDLFERRALSGLSEQDAKRQQQIVAAHGRLRANLSGYGTYGRKAYEALELPLPPTRKKEVSA